MKSPITKHTQAGSTVSIDHNLRREKSVGNPDIDPTRTSLNETLISEPVRAAYERIFGQFVKLYNERQTRSKHKTTQN